MLAQKAVRARMAGRTRVVVDYPHGLFSRMPISLATSAGKQVGPNGGDWLYRVQAIGQPSSPIGR